MRRHIRLSAEGSARGGSGAARRLKALAVPLSVLLLAEVGVTAGTAVADGPQGKKVSDTAQAPARDGAAEAPDEASARAAAVAQERQVEVLGARTENTTLWANPDGTMTQETHAGPVRFREGTTWSAIDVDLERAEDGSVRAKSHPRGLELAGRTGAAGGDLVTLGNGPHEVSLGWQGALPEPVLKGNKATYVNVRPATDLVVEATRTGFEQYLVVKDRSAADAAASITLPLTAKGLNAARNADHSVTFTDAKTEKTVGRLPAPVMWDASRNKQGLAATNRAAVGLEVAGQGQDLELRLTPDRKFLADKDTKFPVTIDPAVFFGTNFDTAVREGVTEDLSASIDLPVGREYGKQAARSFVHFPRNFVVSGKEILNAELNLYSVWSDSCEPRSWELWDTGLTSASTRWSNQPAWRSKAATSTETLGHSPACGSQWIQTDVTGLVKEWATADRAENAIGIRATDEADTTAYKIFASGDAPSNGPSMLVTYEVPADPVKDHVTYWNDVLQASYRQIGGAPGPLARAGAMMHGAVYDAANSAQCAQGAAKCLGDPYLVKVASPGELPDINSAIDHAAFDVLRSVYPQLNFDQELADARSTIPAGVTSAQRAAGTSVGQQAAAAMLQDRQNDGATSNTAYTPSTAPGQWRPTGSGSAATPGWGLVKPFGLTSGSQFRPKSLPTLAGSSDVLKSAEYARQVNQVKSLGKSDSTQRTADQTRAALFWANDLDGTYKPPGQLFEFTQTVSRDRGLSVTANAKLFALTAFSMADAGVVAWDAKYRTDLDLWRPESAVRLDGDGNAATTVDPNWQPLSQDRNGQHFSPPFPAYVSGHATFGGAWAKAMEQWFATDQVTFTATTEDPNAVGVTRTFSSFSAAANENAVGRVWLGVHYDWDGTEGVSSGAAAAGYIAANKVKSNTAATWVAYETLKNLGGCDALGKKLVAEHRWSTYRCERVTTANTDHALSVK
ncbi:DNRLRE domain-containing protein [Streptomyces sp. NPDC017546]|uniref:DNRLRE domain-containing protein n=1 Tax=unclassified Streptomyces TaxID=2593676 RepID=UPI00235E040F|nr:DNRLRE domain-containing protein [Streptomyces sp. MMBL 11-1]